MIVPLSAAHVGVRYAELRASGMSRTQIDLALRTGRIRRVRRGLYVAADVSPAAESALALGGTVDCVSLLRLLGVFVLRDDALHVRMRADASRVPVPMAGVHRHWRHTSPSDVRDALVEAVARAVRCQEPRAAVATLDSALQLRIISEDDLTDVFAMLPRRYAPLRRLVDGRAESGPETLMRLLLRALGYTVELQVPIDGVGRVDLLVDGWLIVECDSRAHHAGWDVQRKDRRRDLAAAALGYTTIRPIAEDIDHHRDQVIAAVRGLLAARAAAGPSHNSGRLRRNTRR